MILGWDIGGVNTKVARLSAGGALTVRSRPFELQRDPAALVRVLRELAADVAEAPADQAVRSRRMTGLISAVTMTAELSQMFRTKREGVHFVLDAVSAAFPSATIRVFAANGRFLTVAAAREEPLAVAAANWAATAGIVAQRYRNALLIDVGTTTTDIIPVVSGKVAAAGRTDPERLAAGELVYSGALRTPVEAIVHEVRHNGATVAVSAEGFALIGDVHLWLGSLESEDYTVPAPDRRPAAREFAGERIARVICADRDMVDESGVTQIAEFIAARQVRTLAAAIGRVCSRHPSLRTAVVTGLGDFIAAAAARAESLEVVTLASEIGSRAARYAPAAAVALLCAQHPADRLRKGSGGEEAVRVARAPGLTGRRRQADNHIDLVVKVGGGLLEHIEHLERVLSAISAASRTARLVVVPGGGPFADVVRHVDERLALGDEEAHWMAVLGIDQYAHLLAARLASGAVVSSRAEAETAHRRGRIPVLAPSTWLKTADPLPHSWDATSDSIAAWIADALTAERLLLIKPPGARGPNLVDAHFEKMRPLPCACDCLDAEEAIALLNRMARRGEAHALEQL
jgi:probable H4MPT-linked C1 transfer pathway protein